jgi:phenylpropionate dioxygenase-like ring-hydroxylating dioxygenase large terminal subunit
VQGIKAEILRGFWYVALPGARLKPGEMAVRHMLGEQILVARGKDGKVFAINDLCPHRGMPLHHGNFDGETVSCAYHAWRYDRTGACVEIPTMVDGQYIDLGKIRCGAYPCVERQGVVWVYFARDGEEPAGATAEPPTIPLFAADAPPKIHVELTFPCSIDHTAYGLMDPGHVAYVHTSPWFRAKARVVKPKQKSFEPNGLGFRMVQHVIPPEQTLYKLLGRRVTADINYQLPGIRIEELHGERHQVVGFTALTPIDDETTTFHQMFWASPGWIRPLAPVIAYFARTFLNQDRDIAVKQREGLLLQPKLMLINDANTQARWWMRLKDEWTVAAREGRDFVNPLKPQTLHFKS